MKHTLAEKILARAAGRVEVHPGEIIWARPDLIIAHDLNYPKYRDMMDSIGVMRIARPESLLLTIDHLPYADVEDVARQRKRMRDDALHEGIGRFHDFGRHGISHNVPVDEGAALPGMLTVTSDTRSPALGCTGGLAIALGAGFVVVMSTGKAWLRVPSTIRVTLTGQLQPGTMSRDAAEWIAQQIGADRADYKVIEFHGEAIRRFDIDQRHTLCNAMVDIGVKSAIVVPDDITREYVEQHQKACDFIMPDDDAEYESDLEFDISGLCPQISLPPDPENISDVTELTGMAVHQAFVGSCIGGKLEDLRAAAAIMKGHKVHPSVRFIVIPATQKIYQKAASEGLIETLSQANCYIAVGACGPCYGSLAPLTGTEVCIATSTRNEPGRMGSHDATVLLANAATVAASAIRGVVTDPREFLS